MGVGPVVPQKFQGQPVRQSLYMVSRLSDKNSPKAAEAYYFPGQRWGGPTWRMELGRPAKTPVYAATIP
ncbi:MAG: hypothetical protein BGO39_02025 [Chloroflexi bacterium 54-19]|nr:MAG: hypothetical protein BGO39_02025 [Chloroflexi bacterium 54-19]